MAVPSKNVLTKPLAGSTHQITEGNTVRVDFQGTTDNSIPVKLHSGTDTTKDVTSSATGAYTGFLDLPLGRYEVYTLAGTVGAADVVFTYGVGQTLTKTAWVTMFVSSTEIRAQFVVNKAGLWDVRVRNGTLYSTKRQFTANTAEE